MYIFQKGFNYSQDGPGNRLVYHLQGCNMRCPWCSNPEGMKNAGGKEYSVEDILSECVRSKMMFFSGGGVTFTGGEASLWFNDLNMLLKKLKLEKINTAIETNGTSEKLSSLAENIDYLIMDFKHYDSDVIEKYTKVGNETIKKNYEYFCKIGRQLHIRIPLINGFNTDNPKRFAEYFSSYNTKNVCFEFLPYHEYGKDKWTEEYKIQNGFISDKKLKEFQDVFREHGLKLVTT